MKLEELRTKTKEELQQQLLDLLQEQFNLRMQQSGESAKPHLRKRARRSIAQVKTVLKQREGEQS